MRRWAIVLFVLVAAAPAASAGGGPPGGECYQDVASRGEGWIAVADSCFEPTQARISAGDVVRWDMQGQVPHTVTFADGPHSGELSGEAFAVRFNQPGTYEYSCLFHPGMAGRVVVDGVQAAGARFEVVEAATDVGRTVAAGTEATVPSPAPWIALAFFAGLVGGGGYGAMFAMIRVGRR